MKDIEALDTHYEAVLDDNPIPRQPVYVDVVTKDHELQPIVPAGWRRGNVKATVRMHAGRNWHRARYHGLRSPKYLLLMALWGVVGVFKIAGKQIHWWWLLEQHSLRQFTATQNDVFGWSKLHKEAKATRQTRGIVLGLELAAAVTVVAILAHLHLWWAWALFVLAVGPLLAHHGRPVDAPIINRATVPPRFRIINADVVLRAYYAAKLGDPAKDDQKITFGSRMDRDGDGGTCLIDLPFGKTFTDAMRSKEQIASGLDVSGNQVFLTRDKSSTRRHRIFIADKDPLAIPAGRTPLLACKPTDVWKPAPFGLDERGRKVSVPLMWNSILIGAQPRKGKTFSARQLALYAALDPYTRILGADGKMSPDWKDFRLVAHRWVFGTHPNPLTADPIPELIDMLGEVKAHIQQVNAILSKLPASVCPEGKITPELSRSNPDLAVWVLVMEEFQVYYETDDKNANEEIAKLLSFIQAVGPSAGVIVLSSSQKPSGVGAGDIQRLFTRYRDNHAGRFALKCGSRQVSEAILGTEAYGAGFDAASLPEGPEYRGVGLLYGLSDETPTVRTYLATGEDSHKILAAARSHRERLGTLTGFAAGEEAQREARDVLRDVHEVFYAGEVWVSWPQLAQRLAEQFPQRYAETTADAISAQVRQLGIEAKKGRDKYQDGSPSVWGVPRDLVTETLQRRDLQVRQ